MISESHAVPAQASPYRLLIVHGAQDVELVRGALAGAGLECTITRAGDADAFGAALRAHTWDLVIADYAHPGFDALAVLAMLQSVEPELSCVVVSGVTGEDRAVQTMRAGARDFLSKDGMQRLPQVVQREMAESVVRRERMLVHSEDMDRDRRLREASVALFELLRSVEFTTGNDAAVYGALTELVSRTLAVDRVSIWMFNEGRTRFRCTESFDSRVGEHESGRMYEMEESPEYFRALEHSRYVEAHAPHQPAPAADTPLRDRDVSSQLDAAIRVRGEMAGALCLDHVGEARRWRSDEQVFVGSIADLLSLVIESNERRRAEHDLRESEERYREIWQHALDGMFTLDPNGCLTSVNVAGSQLTGRAPPDLLGRHFTDFLLPRDRELARGTFEALVDRPTPDAAPIFFTILRPDGTVVQAEATAQRIERGNSLVGILAIVRDVSQRRHLEAQLQQSQKMEAIGRLAGGVAHDFNNLLTAIIGYSQIAAIRPDMPSGAVVDLKEIASAAHRAAALTRQLLAFSRRQVLEPRVLNLNAVVAGIEVLLRRLIGEDVQMQTDLDIDIAPVLADPSQLEQVILNLAVNARDAMPDGGRMVMRTRMSAALDRMALVSADVAPGPYVVFEVSDTGMGMDEETRLHVFEPFFTTKRLGTGLGLSTVYGIVQQSGGGVAVASEVGLGSTFAVFLPVAAGQAADVTISTLTMGPKGSETVLVVEDDDRVRSLASRVLRLAGYTVVEACDPLGAMAAIRSRAVVDLVLTDLVLPQMRGTELVGRLRAALPNLRSLYMSGYRQDTEANSLDNAAFISKPFSPEVLTTAVRAALDATSAEPIAGP